MWILAAVAAIAVLASVYFSPQVLRYLGARSLASACARSNALVLTFDDGPGSKLTSELLDLLQRHDVRATFFLLGDRVDHNREIVDRIAREQHEIGSHSQQHGHAWKSLPWRSLRDIRDGYRTLSRWVAPAAIFRPPYGKLTLVTWLALRKAGRSIGWWTIDSGDTHTPLPPSASVVDAVCEHGGGVVLLHDFDRSPERVQFVLETTDRLVRASKDRGMDIITLGELLGRTSNP